MFTQGRGGQGDGRLGQLEANNVIGAVSFHRLLVQPNRDPVSEHRLTLCSPAPDGILARRIQSYLANVAGREESRGAAQSAWWESSKPAFLNRLATCEPEEFEAASAEAMTLLVAKAPRSAQSGLVVIARTVEDPVSMGAIKLVLSNQDLDRFDDEAGDEGAIIEERITNVLPKPGDVKKGALIPHPDQAADARVIDEQLADPAGYWLKWLGLSPRPKEPALAKLVVATTRLIVQELLEDDPRAGVALAQTIDEVLQETGPVSPEGFTKKAAEHAQIDPTTVWDAVQAREPTLGGAHIAMAPGVFTRVETVITLDGQVKLRGPASELAGRYRIRPADVGEGWVLEVDSTRHPTVKEETKKGRARST